MFPLVLTHSHTHTHSPRRERSHSGCQLSCLSAVLNAEMQNELGSYLAKTQIACPLLWCLHAEQALLNAACHTILDLLTTRSPALPPSLWCQCVCVLRDLLIVPVCSACCVWMQRVTYTHACRKNEQTSTVFFWVFWWGSSYSNTSTASTATVNYYHIFKMILK